MICLGILIFNLVCLAVVLVLIHNAPQEPWDGAYG